MTRAAVIPWSADDTAEALRDRYRAEPEGEVRTRLHALWLLRQPEAGWTPTTVAAALGGHRCTVQQWLRWYREGGLEAVRSPRRGGGGQAPLPDAGAGAAGGGGGGHGGVCDGTGGAGLD